MITRRSAALVLLSIGAATSFHFRQGYAPNKTCRTNVGIDIGSNHGGRTSSSSRTAVRMMRRKNLPTVPAVPTAASKSKKFAPTTSAGEGERIRRRQQTPPQDNPLVLSSTLSTRGGFIGPLTADDEERLSPTSRRGGRTAAASLTAQNLRATKYATGGRTTAVRFLAAAALSIGAIETVARALGRTVPGSTLLVPPLLAPLLGPTLDRSAALLTLLLGPLFSVPFWSALAPFASIALKLSPLPTMLSVRKRGDTAGLPLLPYSAMATMTFVLVVYGLLVGDARIALTHGIGHVISLGYCLTFVKNCGPPGSESATNLPSTPGTHARVGVGIASSLLVAVALLGRSVGGTVAGMTSVVLSCVMYAGPLAALKEAIRTKSARNVPLPYAVASSLNAIAWSVYGYFGREDFMVWAPGFIGLLSSTAQIVLNVVYGDGPGGEGEGMSKRAGNGLKAA